MGSRTKGRVAAFECITRGGLSKPPGCQGCSGHWGSSSEAGTQPEKTPCFGEGAWPLGDAAGWNSGLRGICKVGGSGDVDGHGRDGVQGAAEEGQWKRRHAWLTPPRGEAGGTGGGGHDRARASRGKLGEERGSRTMKGGRAGAGGRRCDGGKAVPTSMAQADKATGLVQVLLRALIFSVTS